MGIQKTRADMKACVFSDSHGYAGNMMNAVRLEKPDAVFFLGDGERDFENVGEELAGRALTIVCGNCDFGSLLNPVELLRINDKIVYCTHGHKQFSNTARMS